MNEIEGTEIDVKFLTMINGKLSEEIIFLREQVRELMIINRQLLDKLLNKEVKRAPVENSDFQPVGGYKSLRSKIEEAEEASRLESAKDQENKEA